MMPTLETERLRLVPLAIHDLDDIAAMFADPEVMEHIGPIRTREQTAERVTKWLAFNESHGYGYWTLRDRASGQFVGRFGLGHFHERGGPEIAYTIVRSCWFHGFATEAGRRVLAFAFQDLGVPFILAATRPDNFGSVRVLQKLGFQWIDTFEYDDLPAVLFRLDADDWKSSRSSSV